jgi:hypothetical protein
MTDRQNLYVDEEQTFTVGQDTFVDSTSENNHAVIFEDNLETGYFYAVDRNNGMEVLDALHIYNVVDVKDKQKPSVVKILWTKDSTKAFLVINDYCHAIFDFKNKAGYCRNAFPESNSNWTKISERKLTDNLLEQFMLADA